MIALDIKKICKERRISQRKLALSIVKAGIYKDQSSVTQTLQKYVHNKMKSIDVTLLNFLCSEYNYKPKDIVIWK